MTPLFSIDDAASAELLSTLTAIESVNPGLDLRGTGEAALAATVASWLRAVPGVQITAQEVMPGRSNILARLASSESMLDQPALLLLAHMDTVPLADQPGQTSPRLADGRLYGRGACDNKGSLAAMMLALAGLAQQPPDGCHVLLAATIDEEHSYAGVRALIQSAVASPDRLLGAIVGEPTRLHPVCAHRGEIYWRLQVAGRAAHGSTPQYGRNAIAAMADVISWLTTVEIPRLAGLPAHPLLGTPTLNIGTISGGVQPNSVPAFCQITVDRRTAPGDDVAALLPALLRQLRDHLDKRGWPDVELTGDPLFSPVPWLDTPIDAPLTQAALNAGVAELGSMLQPLGAPFTTEAGWLSQTGLPVIVLGPGDIAQAHTDDEWIAIDQVTHAAHIYERIARSCAR